MTRHAWTLTDGVYRLRPEGERCGWHVASVWCEGDRWQRVVWETEWDAEHGETVGTLQDAQREAVAHARRVGAMSERDEVEG